MADPKELTAADVAAKFKGATVRVHKLDKKGRPSRDKDGNFQTIERSPTAKDIFSFTEHDDGTVTAITVDGQKLTV